MNRSQRRSAIRALGVDEKKMEYLNSHVTLAEAVQISRGVAEDVVTDYQNRTGHLQVATSLQVELIKEILFYSGIISEEEFKARYIEKAEEFNRAQAEAAGGEVLEEEDSPKMDINVGNVEVKKV